MDRSTTIAIGVAALVFAAVGILALGFVNLGATTTSESAGPPVSATPVTPPGDGSHGVILDAYQFRGGLSFLGIEIREPTFRAAVGFVPPDGCEPDTNNEVTGDGPCSGSAVTGEVSGNGTTGEGHDFLIVAVPISESCRDELEIGDPWPSSRDACP